MNPQKRLITPQLIVQLFIFIILIPMLPLFISWHWSWWQAWAYALITIVGFVISRVLTAKRHPEVIAERAQFMQHEDTQAWDKRLVSLLLPGSALVMLTAGLDALFGWSAGFGVPVNLVAMVIILAAYVLSSYALIENRFFSGTVRIQHERDHRVVSSGPYGWVRHPGYAGAVFTYLATPFLLDSVWAFLPTILLIAILFTRTRLEDQFLQKELDGYQEYAGRVRYRLFPGIW